MSATKRASDEILANYPTGIPSDSKSWWATFQRLGEDAWGMTNSSWGFIEPEDPDATEPTSLVLSRDARVDLWAKEDWSFGFCPNDPGIYCEVLVDFKDREGKLLARLCWDDERFVGQVMAEMDEETRRRIAYVFVYEKGSDLVDGTTTAPFQSVKVIAPRRNQTFAELFLASTWWKRNKAKYEK